jgi:hypothetical protein|tara:strand:+ start:609 stop:791 length:183 start_codon:yes stop_codon:yes gene_type:complete
MAGVGIALRGFGKALKKLTKSKKAKDRFGLFSAGAVTGSLLGEATTVKTKPRKKFSPKSK